MKIINNMTIFLISFEAGLLIILSLFGIPLVMLGVSDILLVSIILSLSFILGVWFFPTLKKMIYEADE